jgi:membrane-bound lytic murein transglycosylase D
LIYQRNILITLLILAGYGLIAQTDSTVVSKNTTTLPLSDVNHHDGIEIVSDFDLNDMMDIIDAQLSESKSIFAEAVLADMAGDTLEALYQFELLFEGLSDLRVVIMEDEYQYLEYNRILNASINYYEKDAETIDIVESGLSVSLLRDRLNEYIYSQTLDDLEYVDETIEVIPGHVPITYNSKVASIIKYYKNRGRKSVQNWLNRMGRYKAIMLPILEEEGVPPELFYLAMIESGLKSNAYSYAKASGFWQFISSTGKVYGLKKDWWVDERRDFDKSTRAAAHYLKDLYEEFDDWYLAFAAYNCGEGRVRREIRRSNTRDYWKLTRLPKQTRNYVPNIMAAIFITSNPEKYGFTITSQSELEWNVVDIDKSIGLDVISECSNIDVATLQLYNPELKQNTIPPLKNDDVYHFRLPISADSRFDSLLSSIEIEKIEEVVFVEHKVRNGESLWLIAKKYGVRISDIVSINKLHKSRYIKPGQRLQIPTSGFIQQRKSNIASQSSTKKIFYTIRPGDTLGKIAQRYSTSVTKLRKWNGLRSNLIRAGQKLIIYVKNKNIESVNNDTQQYYTVRPGDTLGQIAQNHRTSVRKLKRLNSLYSNLIRVGQRLVVK